ncbi:MFS transporter [Aneurinibacillus migulanus]|uniref:MFS transporter n=1 Tax=Aneurinibacillus migulanus TaxID=47500 RepID=UPI0020A07620|nr:MFS transporter [Aneurinibacillus migulanus]MCP1357219.1 MFS transporter [Aneurinibacillus migulanus]
MKRIHYAWMILGLTFLSLLTVQGFRSSFGAFILPWESEFSTTRGMISLLALVSFIVYGLSQPVIGRLIDKVGVRKILSLGTLLVGISAILTFFVTSSLQLFLLYGVIASIGFGGVSGVAASVAVTNWFQEKRGLALGIITAGTSAGQFVLVPTSLFLIEWVGWKTTIVSLGIFLSAIVFPILFICLRDYPEEKGIQRYGEEKSEVLESENPVNETGAFLYVMKTRSFWCLAIPYFICGYTTIGLMDTHFIPFTHYCGYSTKVASVTVSLLAGFNIVGTVLSGQIADHWNNKKFLILLYVVRALSIVLLLIPNQPYFLLIFACLFGLVNFATVAPTSMLAVHYFKQYSVGFVLGLLSLSHQLGSALGAYLPGLLYDVTGNYNVAFTSSIVLLIAAALASIGLPDGHKRV